jgi:Domain of unknown function (DUF4136)
MRGGSGAIAFAGACALALACASPVETAHDQSPAADFARYATYAWIGESPVSGVDSSEPRVDPAVEASIRRAVDAQLATRGYRLAAAEAADLLVGFEVGREQKTTLEQIPGRTTVYTGGYSYGGWYRSAPVRTRTYTEGTLTLDFFERGSHEAVWVGWASRRISSGLDREAVIQDAVARILEPFPAR